MGPKTLKRLAILLATVVVVGVLVFFGQRYQVARMDRQELAKAAEAEEKGQFEKAEQLYQEHLQVAPDDLKNELKYAEVLLKGPNDPARQARAAQVYQQQVTRHGDDKESRRRLAELEVEMRQYVQALPNLEHLHNTMPKNPADRTPEDGVVCFLLGRCQEELDQPLAAKSSYREAIKSAPHRIEAAARLAALLRTKPEKGAEAQLQADRNEADSVIESMVQSNPDNYQAYLERGKYLRLFGKTDDQNRARKDLELALQKNPKDPKVYLELATLAQALKKYDEARQILEDVLNGQDKELASDPALHIQRALLKKSAPGGTDQAAIASLRESLRKLPDEPNLHYSLAVFLAQNGQFDELAKQIEELRRLNVPHVPIDLLEAKYHLLKAGRLVTDEDRKDECRKAIQTLVRLQTIVEQSPDLKSQVHLLMAQAYGQLGDREREREQYGIAGRANPMSFDARFALATSFARRNEIDNAINEFRQLVDQLQQQGDDARRAASLGQLVRLLIMRNRGKPVDQRDWSEVEDKLNLLKASSAPTGEWEALQTEALLAQNRIADAQKLLEQARAQRPKDVQLWLTSVDVLLNQQKADEARKLLDEAKKTLGDSVNLRIERAKLVLIQRSPTSSKDLAAIAQDAGAFSRPEQRRLLESLARIAALLNDRALTADLWLRVALLEPDQLEPRMRLLEFALQGKNKDEIEKWLGEIKRIEKDDQPTFKLGQAHYLIWQAANSTDPGEQAKLRESAESLLIELTKGPTKAPQPHVLLADLLLADATQPDIRDEEKKNKINEAASHYFTAVTLGQRDLNTVNRTTDLLYQAHNKEELSQLRNLLFQGSTELIQQAANGAILHRDIVGAEELLRAARKAHPNDFRVSALLADLLAKTQREGEAEDLLRKAVAAVPADPARWIVLVQILTLTRQLEKAEAATGEAESNLKNNPSGPARCCELLGAFCKQYALDDQRSKRWFDQADRWYAKARNDQPRNVEVSRAYINFLDGTGQSKKARMVLEFLINAHLAKLPDRFRFPALLCKEGDWSRGLSQYQELLAETKNSTEGAVLALRHELLRQYVNDLLKRNETEPDVKLLDEAQARITELKDGRANEVIVLALEARLLKARKLDAKATELVEAFSRRPRLTESDWYNLINLADQIGQSNLVKELTLGALANTKSSHVIVSLAQLREQEKRYDDAEELYAFIVAKYPDKEPSKGLALNNLAWLKALQQHDLDVALDSINHALELGGTNPEYLDTRAVTYLKLRKSPDAVNDLIAAIKLAPSAVKYFHLAQAYLQAGDKASALNAMKSAREKRLMPGNLHPLELKDYQQVLGVLGTR